MRDDDYPAEVTDPQASGLPDTADDDSTAYDEVRSPRWADGPDPAALAGVGPGGSNRYGDTAEEARVGESLDRRLRQEEPDISTDDRHGAWGPSPTSDPNSPISLYDDGQLDEDDPEPVGRLVAPDEGGLRDDERDSVAYDAGAAGGGASAEELAMRRTTAPDYD